MTTHSLESLPTAVWSTEISSLPTTSRIMKTASSITASGIGLIIHLVMIVMLFSVAIERTTFGYANWARQSGGFKYVIFWNIKHFPFWYTVTSTRVEIGKTRNCVETRRPQGGVFSHNFEFFQFSRVLI